jgi:molybdopterin synthase sulfur carrier subunit
MPRVIVPTQLRGYTSGAAEVNAAGDTLLDVLADLDRQFPGFRFRVVDEHDRVRRHVIFFVGMDRQEDLRAVIPAGVDVQIVGALSGG